MNLWDTYHLETNNCTHFATWICNSINLGVPAGVGVMWPTFQPSPLNGTPILVPVTGSNPGALGQQLRTLPLTNLMSKDDDGGIANETFCN